MMFTVLVFLNMVARGLATDPGTKESTYGGTFNFGKAVSHCIKLQEDNYEHWFTGLMNVLLGISGVAYIAQLLQILEHFEEHGADSVEQIAIDMAHKFSDKVDAVSQTLYTVVYNTIDHDKLGHLGRMASSKEFRRDGIKLMKYIYDKVGPGGTTKQLQTTLRIQNEQQSMEETPSEFGERLAKMNDSLTTQVPDAMLMTLFVKNMTDEALKRFLLEQQLRGEAKSLKDMRYLCVEYGLRNDILSRGVDGLSAQLSGKGKGKGKGQKGRGNQYAGRGRGRGDMRPRVCDF